MKPDATLEDYKNRELFLINYLQNQIVKKQEASNRYDCAELQSVSNAYKDILYKLTKDS